MSPPVLAVVREAVLSKSRYLQQVATTLNNLLWELPSFPGDRNRLLLVASQCIQAVKDNPSAGRICVILGKCMKVPSGGETGADSDFALTNHGESLADLVKPLRVASLQLGHFLPKSVVRQFLLLSPHAVYSRALCYLGDSADGT